MNPQDQTTLQNALLELADDVPLARDMAAALKSGQVGGYGTDVLDEEPPRADHPLTKLPNCIVTPHIGSRTAESVQRQAMAAVKNLILAMHGEKPLAQINPEVPVKKVI